MAEKKDKPSIKKILILISIFGISLMVLYVHRAQCYTGYERIKFESAGVNIYANLYYPSTTLDFQEKQPLVIYCHGFTLQRDLDLRIIIELTKRGFFVAALDYQGHGESDGNFLGVDPNTNMPALARDCSNLLDTLEDMPVYKNRINNSQIGLTGHSLGGMVVLMNDALDDRFNTTVAWAPLVNFDPVALNIPVDPGFEDYIPVNLINENNTNSLLIIHHIEDEALPYQSQAMVAQNLTNCSLILLDEPISGDPHYIFDDIAIIETINWFENVFFNSETINGPIVITYQQNYILLIISLFLLILTSIALISFLGEYFSIKNSRGEQNTEEDNIEEDNTSITTSDKNIKNILIPIIKIILYNSFVIGVVWIFLKLYELPGLFPAGVLLIIIFSSVKILLFLKPKLLEKRTLKKRGEIPSTGSEKPSNEIDLKVELKEILKRQYNIKFILYSIISAAIFLGFYLSFSFIYPFAYFFPSTVTSVIWAVRFYIFYVALEIFFRAVIYPSLSFIESSGIKIMVLSLLAIVFHQIIMNIVPTWSVVPAVILAYWLFTIVIVINSIVYENTKTFSSVMITSFLIVEIIFGAAMSALINLSSVFHVFA